MLKLWFPEMQVAEPQMPQSHLSHQFRSKIIPSTRGQSIQRERLPVPDLQFMAEFNSERGTVVTYWPFHDDL